jgi:hypothetical protein
VCLGDEEEASGRSSDAAPRKVIMLTWYLLYPV